MPTILNAGTASRLRTLLKRSKARDPINAGSGNRTGEQIDDVPNQAGHNNLNQLTNIQSAGPTRFAGWMSETGKVTVNVHTSVWPATMLTLTNFAASANLSLGSNVVSVIAWDSRTNLATNRHGVVITNGIPTTLKYDANGNLTNQYTSTYTNYYDWDGEDRLIRITSRSTADPIEYKSEFIYDGFGRRVQIVERTNGVALTAKRYFWCGTEICERRNSTSSTVERRYFSQGEQQDAGLYFYARDHLGSIREMLGFAQVLRARHEYDPYGRRTTLVNDNEPGFGYTGHFVHGQSGLHLAMFRGLDSGMGRWLSRDPIGEARGLNLYGYVGNDPGNATDPLGLEIALQWHRVAASPYDYHTLIRITPQNQALYAGNPLFRHVDANGNHYATLGAGPIRGRLVSEPNRPSDVEPHDHSSPLTLPDDCEDEDEMIRRLFRLDRLFPDNLDYDLYPAAPGFNSPFVADDGYNSNSYISGLLQAAGYPVMGAPAVRTPGWSRPVPVRFFRGRSSGSF